LVAAGMTVLVVNPARVRSFARGVAVLGKTDRLDAVVLARFGRLARPKAWRPAEPLWRDLQALLARVDEVEADLCGVRPIGSSRLAFGAVLRPCCAPSPRPWPRCRRAAASCAGPLRPM
jgi:hypothetical protein